MATAAAIHHHPPPPRRARPLARGRLAPHRVEGRRIASRILREAMADSGTSQAQLGRLLGVHKSTARCLADVDSADAMTIGDLVAVRMARSSLYRLVLHRLQELLDEPPPAGLCPSVHVALVTAELGDVAREVTMGLAGDGVLDAEEARRARVELLQAQAALDALDRDLEAIIREGVAA